jgi:hypothetical protein
VAEFREAATGVSLLVDESPSPDLRGRVLAEVNRTRQFAPGPPARDRAGLAGRRWRRIAAGAVAASVIAVGGAVAAWTIAGQRVEDGRARIAALEAERERMYDVFNAPDVQMKGANVQVNGQAAGRIAAAVSPSLDAGVAMIAGLPTLPRDEVFQMWLIGADGRAVLAGTLAHGQTGGTMLFDWQTGATQFGLSIEPPGGSASPTNVVGLVDLWT